MNQTRQTLRTDPFVLAAKLYRKNRDLFISSATDKALLRNRRVLLGFSHICYSQAILAALTLRLSGEFPFALIGTHDNSPYFVDNHKNMALLFY